MEATKVTKKERRTCFKCGMPFWATLVRKAFSDDWWGPLACSDCCNADRRKSKKEDTAVQRKLWSVCSDP